MNEKERSNTDLYYPANCAFPICKLVAWFLISSRVVELTRYHPAAAELLPRSSCPFGGNYNPVIMGILDGLDDPGPLLPSLIEL